MRGMYKELEQIRCGFKIFMKIVLIVAMIALTWYLIMPRTIFFYRKQVYVPIRGGLNTYDVVLKVGETYHLYIFGINKRVSFQSTDIKVATVNLIGSVRAWRPGTTIIKVRYDKKELRCRVRVVALSKKNVKLKVGQTKRIYVKHAIFGVKYYSSNTDVVSVSRFGTVRAKKKGKATVTAVYRGKKMICTVAVNGK